MELRSGGVTGRAGEGGGQRNVLSQNDLAMFQQGVGFVLGSWTALQLAVDNEWGGSSSKEKAQQFHADIVNWMTQTKVPRYIDELEAMLDEVMLLSFNTEIEDGSLEEVAEQIMIIHEECMEGNYESIRRLSSASSLGLQSASRSQQVGEDESLNEVNEDSASPLGLDADRMDVDNTQSASATATEETGVNLTREEPADGWQLVASRSRRNRHKT